MNPVSGHSAPSAATVERLQSGKLRFENQGAGIWVDVVPHPEARPNFCDENVAAQIRDHGGEALSVWDVTQSGQFVEIEAHVTWRGMNGRLLDVSPSLIGAPRHFVIPSLARFTLPFPGNVLLALTNAPADIEFARYFTLAYAVIAPNHVAGWMEIRTDVLRIWAQEFVAKNDVKCDMEKLMRACIEVLMSRGAKFS